MTSKSQSAILHQFGTVNFNIIEVKIFKEEFIGGGEDPGSNQEGLHFEFERLDVQFLGRVVYILVI